MKTEFPPAELRIAHNAHVADGINNGHTIQINYTGEASLTLGDVSYKLVQYHFHSPSEHTVDGKHFPMEMHMVSKSSDGRLAVVGVFIATGRHNRNFDPVWANLPAKKGMETHVPAVKVDVNALVPTVRTAYRYDGSLTTPPCSEGVKWIVMTTPIEMSSEQIGAFTRPIKDNNRPVQPAERADGSHRCREDSRRPASDAVVQRPNERVSTRTTSRSQRAAVILAARTPRRSQ